MKIIFLEMFIISLISAKLVSPNGIAKVMFAKHSPHLPLCRQTAVLVWTRSSNKQLTLH